MSVDRAGGGDRGETAGDSADNRKGLSPGLPACKRQPQSAGNVAMKAKNEKNSGARDQKVRERAKDFWRRSVDPSKKSPRINKVWKEET